METAVATGSKPVSPHFDFPDNLETGAGSSQATRGRKSSLDFDLLSG
jgi:hypothetical protein